MLTISRLSRWSVAYYERTASEARQASMGRQSAGGGLGEYYTEADTRAPVWLVAGDVAAVAAATGLGAEAVAGGFAGGEVVSAWLDDGVAPNGVSGRGFGEGSVHGFDLTFAAPKSVSLVRALSSDLNEKVVAEAHLRAVKAAVGYLHRHAGYTRVHNPLTGVKDLQRLPGLVGVAYQHETSRCGDPHLHTHVLVPNRQARADGKLVSLDGNSLFHEAKAAGVVYQAVLRHELHAERGFEWHPVGEHSGMADIAGVTKKCVTAWSQRSTRLREWARENLAVVDGQPTAGQLAAAQKATRPAKPESLAWGDLKALWRADARGLETDRAAHQQARRARAGAPRLLLDRARLARMVAGIGKAAPTRADIVEHVGALLAVDAPGDPGELIERIVDVVAVRISDPRGRHQREGSERFTVDAVLVEEEKIFGLVDRADHRSRLWLREEDVEDLSDDQIRAVRDISESPWLVAPLSAPAGAGKTHSLKALRAAARRAHKEVLVVAPTGVAVDQAVRDGAGDRGMTVAKFLGEVGDGRLALDWRTLVVLDEAGMVGTPDLRRLLEATTAAGVKTVAVGDPHQLAPVGQRGGMFERLVGDLPWSQRLSEVWRQRDPAERDASLALRDARGERLRTAVGWYRENGRLHTGGAVAMAADATQAYIRAREEGKDAAVLCDRWEVADAINHKLQAHYTGQQGPGVAIGGRGDAADQQARRGDIIVTHRNDPAIAVHPGSRRRAGEPVDQVRNGNRWRVAAVDPAAGRIAAERLTDGARAVIEGDYLREHVCLGYATTVHAAQGITVGGVGLDGVDRPGVALTVLSDRATRALAYVGMTRGKDENHAYLYPAAAGEDDDAANRRGTKHEAAAALHHLATTRDERPETMHTIAERATRATLAPVIAQLLERNEQRQQDRADAWDHHQAEIAAHQARYQQIIEATQRSQSRSIGRSQDYGFEL